MDEFYRKEYETLKKNIYKIISNQFIKRNPMRLKFLPDKIFLELKYFYYFQHPINWSKPTSFNEKIQWLKLNDRNPIYTSVVDKYEVRKYVKELIGEEYLIGLIGVWNKYEEIDFSKFPNQFVLKTTHDSGSVVICNNKENFNFEAAKVKISESLKKNYYYSGREWPYKNIQPRIIAEEFLDQAGHVPEDYKILCFNGKPDNTMICVARETGTTKYYFMDMDWKLLRCNGWGQLAPENFSIPKPVNFDKMIVIAQHLSKNMPLARVDLFNLEGKIYFGEITLYPDSGFDNRLFPEADIYFGEKLIIN